MSSRHVALYEELRRHLGQLFRTLGEQRESRVEEGHLMPDHVHMLLSIPPKYPVTQVIGYMKGKSAIHIARRYMGVRRNFVGQHFWARGHFVSTAGRDEAAIREYTRKEEAEDTRKARLRLRRGGALCSRSWRCSSRPSSARAGWRRLQPLLERAQ